MDYSGIYEAYQQIYEQPQVSPEDIFECVVNYLLDEGYCDSEESALLVAEAAGVDWILDIVEAADNTIRTVFGPGGKGIPMPLSGLTLRRPSGGFAVRAQRLIKNDKEANQRVTARREREEMITKARNRREKRNPKGGNGYPTRKNDGADDY